MEVLIDNRQDKHRISIKKIRQTARLILDALGCRDAELSILLVDDQQIETLNRAYLHRKGPTNVIAFSMREEPFADLTPHLLGDVVISVEAASKEGKETGISMQKRLNQLMVHGILHLLGYEHENTEAEAKRMGKKSRQLLKMIEI